MTSQVHQKLRQADKGAVLTKAVIRAAERLGLNSRLLSNVIGLSEPTVSRMKDGSYSLSESSKSFELSVLLVRLFRSLDAIAGGEDGVTKAWLKNHNTVLNAKPRDKIQTIAGLFDVISYLDARRALG